MSYSAILLTLIIGVGVSFGGDKSTDEAARRDIAFLEGEWSMLAGQRDGTIPPRFVVNGARRTARGNESTVIMQGRVYMKSRYTVDPSKNPKTIDYDVLEGEYRGQKQQGIYAIEGNTVKFCFAAPGRPRPTDFSAPAGSGRSYSAWQKISGPSAPNLDSAPATGATYQMPARQRFGSRLFSRFGNNGGSCGCRLRLFGGIFAR